MSLLTIIQTACDNLGLPRPTAVVSTTDSQVRQLLSIANQEGKELSGRFGWQALTKEVTHTTVAAELQGTLAAIIGASFSYVLLNSFWDRTQNRPIFPLSATDWQRLKSSAITGPYPQFRIRENKLYALPVPSAGHSWAFEYMSKNWCQDVGASTTYNKWNADTDTGLLDEDLMTLGIQWRWLKRKGFSYDEDFRTYETQVQDAIARDGAKKTLDMGGGRQGTPVMSSANVQEGNWSL